MKVTGEEDCLKIEDDRIIPKDQPILVVPDISERLQNEQQTRPAKCPPQAQVSEVTECLLLCAAPAVSPERLRDLGVTCVVNAAPELPDTPLPPGVAYLRVHADDSPNTDLAAHFDTVADTVEQVGQSGGRTLIHCVAGVSRSAALCLAYLVKHRRLPLRKAFAHLRSRRACVRPNSGFFRQLIELERRELGQTSVAMVHNPAAGSLIPDVYEPDYQNMLWYQQHYNRNFGRH